jgi:uncharacterized protein DUF1707
MSLDPSMRASDTDRENVAERLRDAHAEGRLSMEEFEGRLDSTYAAKTLGELAIVTRDLPATAPPPSVPPTVRDVDGGRRGLPAAWSSWASAVLITSVIWAITDLGGYYWPIWVAGPWGAVLLARTLFGHDQERPGRRDGERDHC